jgi:hypothetical protein
LEKVKWMMAGKRPPDPGNKQPFSPPMRVVEKFLILEGEPQARGKL